MANTRKAGRVEENTDTKQGKKVRPYNSNPKPRTNPLYFITERPALLTGGRVSRFRMFTVPHIPRTVLKTKRRTDTHAWLPTLTGRCETEVETDASVVLDSHDSHTLTLVCGQEGATFTPGTVETQEFTRPAYGEALQTRTLLDSAVRADVRVRDQGWFADGGPGSSARYEDVVKTLSDRDLVGSTDARPFYSNDQVTFEYGFKTKRGTFPKLYSEVFSGATGTIPKMPAPDGTYPSSKPGTASKDKWHLNGAQYMQYYPDFNCCMWTELPPATLNLKHPFLSKVTNTGLPSGQNTSWEYVPMTKDLTVQHTPTLIGHTFPNSTYRNSVPGDPYVGSRKKEAGFYTALQMQRLRNDSIIHYRVIPKGALEFQTSDKQPSSSWSNVKRSFIMPQADMYYEKSTGRAIMIATDAMMENEPYSDPDFVYPNLYAVDLREHDASTVTDPPTRGTLSFQAQAGHEYVLATGSKMAVNVTQTPTRCLDLEGYAS